MTAHRRRGNQPSVEKGKGYAFTKSGLQQNLKNDGDFKIQSKSLRSSDLNKIDYMLEEVLLKYGPEVAEKQILCIISEFDDRNRIDELRQAIRTLTTRLQSGEDHSTMRMILRTILRSKRSS